VEKDENCGPFADSQIILNAWKNYFSQLLSLYVVSDDIQITIHTAEPSVPEFSSSEAEIDISKL
jgi:hypothetical protein